MHFFGTDDNGEAQVLESTVSSRQGRKRISTEFTELPPMQSEYVLSAPASRL